MRELSEAEIECVSGGEGAAPRDNPGDVIVVTARRKPDGGISPIDWFNTPGSHRNSAMNAAWATATPNQRVEAMGYNAYASIDDGEMTDCDGFETNTNRPQAPETWDVEVRREWQATMDALAYYFWASSNADKTEMISDISATVNGIIGLRGAADAFGIAFGLDTSFADYVTNGAYERLVGLAAAAQYSSADAAFGVAEGHWRNFCQMTGLLRINPNGGPAIAPPLPRANGRAG